MKEIGFGEKRWVPDYTPFRNGDKREVLPIGIVAPGIGAIVDIFTSGGNFIEARVVGIRGLEDDRSYLVKCSKTGVTMSLGCGTAVEYSRDR